MAGSSYSKSEASMPLHLCFFFCILLMFVGVSWYANYESVIETVLDQIKLVLMVSPLLLLLVVHWLSNVDCVARRASLSSFLPLPEKDSLHRAGGTPWGVGFLLVFLLFMISYQSSFQERWFPALSR